MMIFPLRILPKVPIWTAIIYHQRRRRHYLRPHRAAMLVNWPFCKCLCFTRFPRAWRKASKSHTHKKTGNSTLKKWISSSALSKTRLYFDQQNQTYTATNGSNWLEKRQKIWYLRRDLAENGDCHGRFLVPPALENNFDLCNFLVG